jgi:hypothetical protein
MLSLKDDDSLFIRNSRTKETKGKWQATLVRAYNKWRHVINSPHHPLAAVIESKHSIDGQYSEGKTVYEFNTNHVQKKKGYMLQKRKRTKRHYESKAQKIYLVE